jgi:GMP synthase-like glutamine amidotransferase
MVIGYECNHRAASLQADHGFKVDFFIEYWMLMRVLIIENMAGTPHGQIGIALEEAKIEVRQVLAYNGEALPKSAEGFDGLIILGGEQNALDDEHYPYMPDLCELIRQFGAADKSVLGVCLGAQLLARAYGGENRLNVTREFGWQQVSLTEAGQADPVLGTLGAEFPIFEWHVDSFTLPSTAVHLAENETAKNQAFRIGRATYGMQFHFEANQSVVAGWCENFESSVEAMSPGWASNFTGYCQAFGSEADEAGLNIARQWVKTLSH